VLLKASLVQLKAALKAMPVFLRTVNGECLGQENRDMLD